MVTTTNVLACSQCGARGRMVYTGLTDRYFRVQGRWSVLACEACCLLWLHPRPITSDIPKLYCDYYTHVSGNARSTTRTFRQALKFGVFASRFGYANVLSPPFITNFVSRMLGLIPAVSRRAERELLYLHAARRGRLLDVGCGDGYFLGQMRELGWTIYGVEPDLKAAQAARCELGCEVQSGSIHDAVFQDDFFDAITLCHVIEHVPDPLAVLRRCNSLLKPGGTLVVATPNARALGHRLLKGAWRELDPPRHLFVFTPQTLMHIVKHAGLQPERLLSSPRNAGQIWSTSRQIQREGRMNPGGIAPRLRLEGLLFSFAETVAQALSTAALCEEITVIARKV